MAAVEVALKSPFDSPFFQRGNFYPDVLNPSLEKRGEGEICSHHHSGMMQRTSETGQLGCLNDSQVIPAERAAAPREPESRNKEFWVPACAGTTAEESDFFQTSVTGD